MIGKCGTRKVRDPERNGGLTTRCWPLTAGCLLLAVAAVILLLPGGTARAGQLAAKEIIMRAADEYDRIRDYTVDAKLTVDSPAIHVPETAVRIYYKKPDKLHAESKGGFAILPKRGIVVGNPLRDMMKDSELSLAGSERVLGRECFAIQVTFGEEGHGVQSRVWIDKKRWVVVQMSANPDQGPSLKLKLWYSKVGGKYWMPTKSWAEVALPSIPGVEAEKGKKAEKPTTITIRFANYRVNTGLSDKIFKKRRSN